MWGIELVLLVVPQGPGGRGGADSAPLYSARGESPFAAVLGVASCRSGGDSRDRVRVQAKETPEFVQYWQIRQSRGSLAICPDKALVAQANARFLPASTACRGTRVS